MEDIKTYRYPLRIRFIMRANLLFGLAMMIGFFAVGGGMIYMTSGLLGIIGIVLCFWVFVIFFFGRNLVGGLVGYPDIEIYDDKIRILGLFIKSDWFDIQDIVSVEFFQHPSTMVMDNSFYIVESSKLPWANEFVARPLRLWVGKKGRCFFVGQRIREFEELIERLEVDQG